ncbi:hypothetical protein ACJJTC_019310 [Scirpophaga incertulas]
MVGLFEEFMLLLFDHHAPVKIISIKPDKSFPWVTETLKQMMHLRNQALRMYRATKSESDKTSWKDLQVMVRTSMDAEKRAFFNHFVNSQVQNGKTFWKSLQLKALAIPSQESTLPCNLNDPNTINLHFLDVQCDPCYACIRSGSKRTKLNGAVRVSLDYTSVHASMQLDYGAAACHNKD